MSQEFEKLKTLLKELFQLDQPDLDFGLYRIMHAKTEEVTQFLDKDLLPQVRAAFAEYQPADKAALQKELSRVIAGVEAAGMDPAQSPKVRELTEKIKNEAVDLDALERETYDHLYSFFRRYYSEGDFLAKRVYKPGVYSIPYEGEEVMLHWANKDQYYIKTSEYLRDYSFRLRPHDDTRPMRVHFRLVDAAEDEHGNVKPAEGKDRVFILAAPGESGRDFIAEVPGPNGTELSIHFEYRPATLTDWPEDVRVEKSKPPAQKDLTALAVKRVLASANVALAPWIAELGKPNVSAKGEAANYTRLEAHLKRYAARNTFDYFIHKDLGTFLRRELDFYIKNEVMHLDDVENESVPKVEQYLSKIKIIRRIAAKIVSFLAQLEDFQRKLWLKKSFLVDTHYCVTLGCVPEEFYPGIAANDAQRAEWIELFAIDEIKGDLTMPAFSVPLTAGFLMAHQTLMLDTRHFDDQFTSRLLEAIGNIEEQMDGLLIHSENFQALSLIGHRYREKVKCIYLDPPYNTGSDGFAYKDAYQHSSWMAMMQDRILAGIDLLIPDSLIYVSIDRDEHWNLEPLLFQLFGKQNFVEDIIWQKAYGGGSKTTLINNLHEYVVCFSKDKSALPYLALPPDPKVLKYYKFSDSKVSIRGKFRPQPLYTNSNDYRENLTYPLPCPSAAPMSSEWNAAWKQIGKLLADNSLQLRGRPGNWSFVIVNANRAETPWTEKLIFPPKQWQWEWKSTRGAIINDELVLDCDGDTWTVNYKQYRFDEDGKERGKKPGSLRVGPYTQTGTKEIDDLFNSELIKFPKPAGLIEELVGVTLGPSELAVADYFAGSGTTGHAVINLNRKDGERRKFMLVEMGDYFDTVLLPRIKKVTFTSEWKAGKPKRLATREEAERSPRIIKVIRLESYEDTLNNLDLRRTSQQESLLNLAEAQGADGLKEQYLLRYMLDVETRGSQSLLNIAAFTDPTAYTLKVKRPGSDESRDVNVDLVETFNYLIGLTVQHIAAPQTFTAAFTRDSEKRLRLKGRIKEEATGPYWFRTVTGTLPDERKTKTLVIWRKRPGGEMAEGIEQDNLVLEEWFTKQGYSSKDSEFDLIYVNGDNNLENLKTPQDTWKVRLIEEDFHRLMFDTEGV